MIIKKSVLRSCLQRFIDTSSMSDGDMKNAVIQFLQEIQFNLERLPFLYRFKKDVVDLCVSYLVDTGKKQNVRINADKETRNIGDVFVRWMFNSIAAGTIDYFYFLPTNESFIDLIDMEFYIKQRHMKSCIPFPIEKYRQILIDAKSKHISGISIPSAPRCTKAQIERLASIYQSDSHFDLNVDKILNRYNFMGGLNNSLSTPPAVMYCVNQFGMNSHELFGTPLNTCSPTFCSPFPDEIVFGSSGSFFEFTKYKKNTVYFANPPFDEKICDKMAEKLLVDLERKEFALIIIIPVWDTDQQRKYAKTHKTIDYGLPFHAYRNLVNSRFFKGEKVLFKETYPFYNYFTNKLAPSSTTHLINLGKAVDLDFLEKTWGNKDQQIRSAEIIEIMSKERAKK